MMHQCSVLFICNKLILRPLGPKQLLTTFIGAAMKTSIASAVLISIGLMLGSTASAQRHDEGGSTHGLSRTTGKGTITQIDLPAKKVTLDHEPIGKYKMEAGSHGFPIRSASTAAKVAVGDKVDFTIESRGNTMVITRLHKQK
ncbi:copper-binding protein [Pseudoduganella umbonata]|uniref:Copper-binding protein n=2 Tax=Pseudoduganella umbonata TaxID=864828 RepID=A0ABX5UNK8_9BURK|nr:copper-binding protein [Pseudoduganella umbonata]